MTSETMTAVKLLTDIAGLAEELSTRPRGNLDDRRRRCEDLSEKLEAELRANSTAKRYLENFAPLLLTAIDRTLYRQYVQSANFSDLTRWQGLVAHLWMYVRADAGAAIDSMHQAAEAATR